MLNNKPLNTADIITISGVEKCKKKIVKNDEGRTYFRDKEPNDPAEYGFSVKVKTVCSHFVNEVFSHESADSFFIYSKRYKKRSQAQTALEHLLTEINDLWGSLKHINI